MDTQGIAGVLRHRTDCGKARDDFAAMRMIAHRVHRPRACGNWRSSMLKIRRAMVIMVSTLALGSGCGTGPDDGADRAGDAPLAS
jgi:hypothetical protein